MKPPETRREAGPNRLPQEARSTTPNTSAKALPMTDIDALARQLARKLTLFYGQNPATDQVSEAEIASVLRDISSESFAAGAQAMREAAANYVTLKYGAALISIDIRALPLPDEKEKP